MTCHNNEQHFMLFFGYANILGIFWTFIKFAEISVINLIVSDFCNIKFYVTLKFPNYFNKILGDSHWDYSHVKGILSFRCDATVVSCTFLCVFGLSDFFRRILRTCFSREREKTRRKRHKVSIIKIQASLPVATMERARIGRDYVCVYISYLHFFLYKDLILTIFMCFRVYFLILGSRQQWKRKVVIF